MGKGREQSHNDPTSIPLLAAFLGGVGVLFYGESLLHDLQDPGPHAQVLTGVPQVPIVDLGYHKTQ